MDIVTYGLAVGMANALLAVGIVLIYMSSRVINMAHGEFGAFTVAMMLALTRNAHLNYWLALLLSLTATAALAAIVERTVLARLFNSPRLILLIATIGVAQLIIVLRLVLPKPSAGGEHILAGGAGLFPVPLSSPTIHWDRVVLYPEHFMALIAGPLLALGLAAFLRWSPYGIALRAAAENSSRARLLGIPVRRVSTMTWIISAVFAGVAAVLLAPIIGFSATEAVGLPILMRGLAAAAIARFESVGIAFGVGLALGVTDQLVTFWTGRSGLTDLVLLAVILVVLVGRTTGSRRTDASEESSWESAEVVRPLPAEIAEHDRWRLLLRVSTFVAIAVVAAAPIVLKASATFFLASVFLIGAVVVSMTVLTGWAGQISLGQWAIAGVGGVFGAKLLADTGFPFLFCFIAAAATGGVVALLLGLPAVRLDGSALAVVTLGFAVTAASWLYAQGWFKPSHAFVPPAWLSTDRLYGITVAFLLVVVGGTRRLHASRVGRRIIAVRDNPRQAASYGVPVVQTKLTAFVLSGVIAASAGFLWSVGTGLAGTSAFPPVRSFGIVSAAVIGGLGTISGALLGALYMWGVPYFGAKVSPYLGLLATGGGLLALLLFLPGGLARAVFNARDLLAKVVTGLDPRPLVVPVGDGVSGEVEVSAG